MLLVERHISVKRYISDTSEQYSCTLLYRTSDILEVAPRCTQLVKTYL